MSNRLDPNHFHPNIHIPVAHALNTYHSPTLNSPKARRSSHTTTTHYYSSTPNHHFSPINEPHYRSNFDSPTAVVEPSALYALKEGKNSSFTHIPEYLPSYPTKETSYSHTFERGHPAVNPTALHALRENKDSLYTNLSQHRVSVPTPQSEYGMRVYKKCNTDPRKPKINVEEADHETNEFTAGHRPLIDRCASTGGRNQLPTTNVKTMAELMESGTQFAGTTKASAGRNIMFTTGGSLGDWTSSSHGRVSMPVMRSQTKKKSCFSSPGSREKAVFLNLGILANIASFLDCGDVINFRNIYKEFRAQQTCQNVFSQRLNILLLRGLNERDQHQFWNALVNFRRLQENYSYAFTSQLMKPCAYVKDIRKDLDRTLPEYEKFSTEKGREALLKVLAAISNTVKDVGYIQGLNSISGALLFYLNEEKSYWTTLYMLEKLKVKNILQEGFHSVHILNYQLHMFLQHYVPEVITFLNQGTVDLSYFTTPWMITLFSYLLTLPNTIKAWNFFFIYGNSFLVQLALAIFSRYKHKILAIEVDELGSFFKYDLKEISQYDEGLFEEALKFQVTEQLMFDLEDFYHKGKPQLALVTDSRNRLQWKMLSPSICFAESPRDRFSTSIVLDSNHNSNHNSNQNSHHNTPTPNQTSKKVGFQTPTAEKGREIVQNIVNKITVDFPEALKGIFTKSGESQQTPKRVSRTEPTENTDSSFVFDSDLKLGTLTDLAHSQSPVMTRNRHYTEDLRKQGLNQYYKGGINGMGSTMANTLETNPNCETENSFRIQVSSTRKKAQSNLSQQKFQFGHESESLFGFRPKTRPDLDPVTPSYVKKQEDAPMSLSQR